MLKLFFFVRKMYDKKISNHWLLKQAGEMHWSKS